ncbi:MAG: hypothetical protein HY926_14425 [Elusimicrobia bacterium]|nr:hypothetical protein [Elusimicrobiota bacterium]
MTADPRRAARRASLSMLLLWLAPASLFAAHAGVSASPLPSDRQALENLFSNGGPAIRFVFSPSLRGRDVPAAAKLPPAPPVPAVDLNGAALGSYRFGGGAEPVLASAIDAAQTSVFLAAPVFASPQVSEALVRAKRRKVDVRLLTSYGQVAPAGGASRSAELRAVIYSGALLRSLPAAGRVRLWSGSFALLDGRIVEMGSFKPGDAPAAHHGLAFRDDPGTVLGFSSYWAWLWSQAKPLSGLAVASGEGPQAEEELGSLRFKGRSWPAWAMPVQGVSEDRLASAISICRTSVDAVLPRLTSRLAQAILDARGHGAVVRIVAGQDLASGGDLQPLLQAGVQVSPFGGEDLRAQFAVLDGELAQLGSFETFADGGLGAALFSTAPADLRGFAAEFEALQSFSR